MIKDYVRCGTWLGSVVPGCVAFSCPAGQVGPTVGPDRLCCVLCICCPGSAPPPWLLPSPLSSSAGCAWHGSPGACAVEKPRTRYENRTCLKFCGSFIALALTLVASSWDSKVPDSSTMQDLSTHRAMKPEEGVQEHMAHPTKKHLIHTSYL